MIAGPGHVLPLVCAAVAALILATWLLSLALKDASVIDPVWGLAFVAVAVVGLLAGSGAASRRWLLLALTACWGLRLAVHLTRRKLHEREEDRRYRALREAHASNFAVWSLLHVFLVQGVLVLVISLPLQVGSQRPSGLGWAIVPGLAVYVRGPLLRGGGR